MNKLENLSPRDGFCHIWLKWTHWFCRTRWKVYNCPPFQYFNAVVYIVIHLKINLVLFDNAIFNDNRYLKSYSTLRTSQMVLLQPKLRAGVDSPYLTSIVVSWTGGLFKDQVINLQNCYMRFKLKNIRVSAIALISPSDPFLWFYGFVYILIYILISFISFDHPIFNNYTLRSKCDLDLWHPQVVPLQPKLSLSMHTYVTPQIVARPRFGMGDDLGVIWDGATIWGVTYV